MNNLIQPANLFDAIVFSSAVLAALIYYKNYTFCNSSLFFGVGALIVSILLSELFFTCNSLTTHNVFQLFYTLKECYPFSALFSLYLASVTIIMSLTGYIRVTFMLVLRKVKNTHNKAVK